MDAARHVPFDQQDSLVSAPWLSLPSTAVVAAKALMLTTRSGCDSTCEALRSHRRSRVLPRRTHSKCFNRGWSWSSPITDHPENPSRECDYDCDSCASCDHEREITTIAACGQADLRPQTTSLSAAGATTTYTSRQINALSSCAHPLTAARMQVFRLELLASSFVAPFFHARGKDDPASLSADLACLSLDSACLSLDSACLSNLDLAGLVMDLACLSRDLACLASLCEDWML